MLESRRLAYAVPRPDVVNRSFTRSCRPTLPVKDVDALGGVGGLFVDRSVDVFRRDGFVAGYVQCRSDPAGGRGTVAAAVEMRDAAGARRAVRDLVPTLAGSGDRVTPLDGMDGATAVAGVDRTSGRRVLQTVLASDRLVLYQYTDDTDGRRMVDTAVRILRSALARARNYRPTPLDRMARLRPDPHHLRRLLVVPAGTALVTGGGYDLDAYYGLAEDPEAERALLAGAGFVGMYSNQAEHQSYSVYQLAGPAAAARVRDGFAAIERRLHRDLVPLRVPAAGSGSVCFAFTAADGTLAQRCFFTTGRYLYQVDAFGFPAAGRTDPAHIASLAGRQRDRSPR
ncbi:MAG TPA: hypothetical protein VFX70_04045 [Mycobacteriales bacterium]|nr:hypothetical protein [Mycobacteriales bacterium]